MKFLKYLFQSKKKETLNKNSKEDYKSTLDFIQNEIYQNLKQIGFKKRGRTFNRKINNGIVQVINFQSGKYTSIFYGKFTVNLGVYIEEIYALDFDISNKKFVQEYDCQVRNRLNYLKSETDVWWNINFEERQQTIEEIKELINTTGLEWFRKYETRDKICINLNNEKSNFTNRVELDIALIKYFQNKDQGTELLKKYYNKRENSSLKSHLKYVEELAKKLKIELK